ncbi:MAG: hypothetical protein L3J36_05215 [Rhodobacteraceae bacterium]|nr:hypothetical protein [Paracoccaceae bacterium]
MKLIAHFVQLGLILTACAPLSIYHRAGVSVTRMQSDQLACEVRAVKDAPVANQIRQNPPIFMPSRRVCNGPKCTVFPGYWAQGQIYTVDVNAGLRARVEGQCMAQKGYRPVELELCDSKTKAQVVPGQTSVLPKLTQDTCAIRHQDGRWQIVTTGG